VNTRRAFRILKPQQSAQTIPNQVQGTVTMVVHEVLVNPNNNIRLTT